MFWQCVDQNPGGPVFQTSKPFYRGGWLHIAFRPLTGTHVWARNTTPGDCEVMEVFDAEPILERNRREYNATVGVDQKLTGNDDWVPYADIPSPWMYSNVMGFNEAWNNGDHSWIESVSKDTHHRGLSVQSKRITPDLRVAGARRKDGTKVLEGKR